MRKDEMFGLAKDLFPINRSITGEGVRESLQILQTIVPDVRISEIDTGVSVFDWEVPPEWRVRDAYIQHLESGLRFAEFSRCNLHLVGYSAPVRTELSLEELLPKIHSDPGQPDWIPYVTSYYNRDWGFCLSDREKSSLPSGKYKVVIDTELFHGSMTLADAVFPGGSPDEILFSTYICHPSMANNEVSGPTVQTALMDYVSKIKDRQFTYRFVFVPETIGSLAYLSTNLRNLQQRVVAGFVLSCVGDERAFSIVKSPRGETLADEALEAALLTRENARSYSFMERGSDERQYCAPGIDLPVVGFCRSKYGEYPEYHTSADNFDVVTAEGLWGAFEVVKDLVDSFEAGIFPRAVVLGEPQLGKRGLYPNTSKKGSYADVELRMNLLAYADGHTSIFQIAKLGRYSLSSILAELELLKNEGLLETRHRAG